MDSKRHKLISIISDYLSNHGRILFNHVKLAKKSLSFKAVFHMCTKALEQIESWGGTELRYER